ncbi:MAG: hypothetical protein C4337_04305, partial [Armatimonadota bacterium]
GIAVADIPGSVDVRMLALYHMMMEGRERRLLPRAQARGSRRHVQEVDTDKCKRYWRGSCVL